ncbi:hypothetical protein CRG98_011519 [Punica granatum]|uniref:CCHC-type domain-containing protein n=1 Tax=Punica granatum TaxID=22663 RepID=A0A2I0KIC3_PUNGR|nr:hypothetical protein CRG98_011519 [Punica granatum]
MANQPPQVWKIFQAPATQMNANYTCRTRKVDHNVRCNLLICDQSSDTTHKQVPSAFISPTNIPLLHLSSLTSSLYTINHSARSTQSIHTDKFPHYPSIPSKTPLQPQDTPPLLPMENADFDSSLAEIFGNQMTMDQSQEILNLQTNEEEAQESIPLTLLIKPFGFKPPPPKAIIPRLLQAWNIKRGVTITPKKFTENILICMFRDERDMKHVEKDRAWSIQGAHMRLARWDKGLSLEEIKFDSITFWIQIRGIPPKLLSKQNISRLAERAGRVLEIDWKDTPTLPKWYVTPRALVQVPVTRPLCPGRRINRKNGSPTWVFFKYEYLKPFCYDCGILGHDQTHCTSKTTAPLNLYGPWLRFDNQTNLLPPQIETSETPTPPAHYPDPDPSSPTARKGAIP